MKSWLDTTRYPTGIIQGRRADCDSQPLPTIRKVALADVTAQLPADTAMVSPEDRDRIVRERRLAFVQRPQWLGALVKRSLFPHIAVLTAALASPATC